MSVKTRERLILERGSRTAVLDEQEWTHPLFKFTFTSYQSVNPIPE